MSRLERAAVAQRALERQVDFLTLAHGYDCALCGARIEIGEPGIVVTAGRRRVICTSCAAAIWGAINERIHSAALGNAALHQVQGPRSKVQDPRSSYNANV
jgi:hypothetical protein